MAAKSRVTFAATGRGYPKEDPSSTRRKIQEVMGQARAALRQSQQFRPIPKEGKNGPLSSKLQFTRQPQEDYWTSTGDKDKHAVEPEKDETKGFYETLPSKPKKQVNPDEDFGMPFRDAARKSPGSFSKTPSRRRKPQIVVGTVGSSEQLSSDASTTSLSMDTNDLKVSTGSEDYSSSEESQASVKKSINTTITRSSKKEAILKEWEVHSTVKLTPLNTAATSSAGEVPDIVNVEPEPIDRDEAILSTHPRGGDGEIDEDETLVPLPGFQRPPPTKAAAGKVEADEMGFSRAHIVKSSDDPHWFEKALLARGEVISEAAYKAHKTTQSLQIKQQAEDLINQNVEDALKKTKGKPIFNNLTDPEYTADWLSDGGLTSAMSEVDMPISDYIKDEDLGIRPRGELEMDSIADVEDDEIDTESMIHTATELERSGMLDEISENLQSILAISDIPESQNFSGMSQEEKNFAREYDEVMASADEPLQSIFLKESQSKSSAGGKGSRSASQTQTEGQDESTETTGHQARTRSNLEDDDDYDDNTFIQVDSTTSSFTKSKSLAKRLSSKSLQKSSSSTLSAGNKEKRSVSSLNTSVSSGVRSVKFIKEKASTSSTGSKSTGGLSSKSKASNSKSKTKSYASTTSSTSKRLNSLPIPPDPPKSRHQKNILNLLEKEVYQKEVKRIRSEKVREERNMDKQRKIAKESLERNKTITWKDPDYTEILLPELFKYKSVSGLQAAKAKKSILTPAMNYGAPYFQMNGALSGTEGTEAMLAAAKVESLDIPDLVREVLASNERMYKMTVEASEQMAKKAYKDKIKRNFGGKIRS